MGVVPFCRLRCAVTIAPTRTGLPAHLYFGRGRVGARPFFKLFSFSNASFRCFSSECSSSGAPRRGVAGGTLHPESADPFKPQKRRQVDLKLGPYAGGRFFVSPKEDPKEFILCVLIVAIFIYTLVTTYTQPGGETVFQRRRRIIKERLMREAGLTYADLDELEAEDAPLSN